jgi:hypothetical protein
MKEEGISLMLKHVNEPLEADPLVLNDLCILKGES